MEKDLIGQRIREARRGKDLTQEKLADDIHISESYMTLIEQGKRSMSIDILEKISHRLGVSSDYLLRGNKSSRDESLFLDWLNIVSGRTEAEVLAAHDSLRNFFKCLDRIRESEGKT